MKWNRFSYSSCMREDITLIYRNEDLHKEVSYYANNVDTYMIKYH